MANSNTQERRDADEHVVSPTITECLTPLLAKRDQIESEEADLKARIKSQREALYNKGNERKDIEKVLRAGGMIATEPKPEHNAPQTKGSLIEPHPRHEPPNRKAAESWDKASKAIEDMEGEPFQISMIEKRCGVSRETVERVIGIMRGEDRVRMIGKLPAIERKKPGGPKAKTFQEVS